MHVKTKKGEPVRAPSVSINSNPMKTRYLPVIVAIASGTFFLQSHALASLENYSLWTPSLQANEMLLPSDVQKPVQASNESEFRNSKTNSAPNLVLASNSTHAKTLHENAAKAAQHAAERRAAAQKHANDLRAAAAARKAAVGENKAGNGDKAGQ